MEEMNKSRPIAASTERAQLNFFRRPTALREPPSTRYQGSKLKLLPWIWENIEALSFQSALDVFGGTGCVSYFLKAQGFNVTYNDNLRFNREIGKAVVENSSVTLTDLDVEFLTAREPSRRYDDFIARTFPDIYFTPEENQWLDVVCQNIARLSGEYKRALAYAALFQACIIKRPYNLFHRKNLYMRTAKVPRSFGNKATWDTPFEVHFRNFVTEFNRAVFESGQTCRALCHDALDVPGEYDLVYIDPPYMSGKGVSVDYQEFYHFLEGMTDYERWESRIDFQKKHRPLRREKSPWLTKAEVHGAFEHLFRRYSSSILVVSYRTDGIPSEQELHDLLTATKKTVKRARCLDYKYVLSTNETSKEALLIGM